jgi:hypothetical protein
MIQARLNYRYKDKDMNSLNLKVAKLLQTILNDKARELAKGSGYIELMVVTGSGFYYLADCKTQSPR